MDKLNISHKREHNLGNDLKNFEEQPSGPHALEFLEAYTAAWTSFGLNEGTFIHVLVLS